MQTTAWTPVRSLLSSWYRSLFPKPQTLDQCWQDSSSKKLPKPAPGRVGPTDIRTLLQLNLQTMLAQDDTMFMPVADGPAYTIMRDQRAHDYWGDAIKDFNLPEYNQNSARIWLMAYLTYGFFLDDLVQQARTHKTDLIILTGTHGTIHGQRTPASAEKSFYDEYRQYHWCSPDGIGNIQVLDITTLDEPRLKQILNGKTDVAVSFCYSRNDTQIRKYLGLTPTANHLLPRPSPYDYWLPSNPAQAASPSQNDIAK